MWPGTPAGLSPSGPLTSVPVKSKQLEAEAWEPAYFQVSHFILLHTTWSPIGLVMRFLGQNISSCPELFEPDLGVCGFIAVGLPFCELSSSAP